MFISDLEGGRDNNFNLIRLLAAVAVLVSHAFALALGSPDAEPLRASLGMTFGTMAVDVFFMTSGFLVTASLVRRQDLLQFLWSRILRIYPALWVMLALTVLGLGSLMSTQPVGQYLLSAQTHDYLFRNVTMLSHAAFTLPGVFADNPYPRAVNGSLWTLPYELKMYGILMVLWLVLVLAGPRRVAALKVCSLLLAAGAFFKLVFAALGPGAPPHEALILYFSSFMFFYGACFYLFRHRVALSPLLFAGLLVALLAASANRQLFLVTYVLGMGYLLFYLAYVPAGVLRLYNRLGDYSYGTYLYAFPVEQTLVHLMPGVQPLALIVLSGLVTLPLAVLSWHLVERNALTLRPAVGSRAAWLFRFRRA